MVYYEYNFDNNHYIYFSPVILNNEKGERVVPKIHNIAKYSKLWAIIMNTRKTEDYILMLEPETKTEYAPYIPASLFDDEYTVNEIFLRFNFVGYKFKKGLRPISAKIYTTSELFSQLAEDIKIALYTALDYRTRQCLRLSLV